MSTNRETPRRMLIYNNSRRFEIPLLITDRSGRSLSNGVISELHAHMMEAVSQINVEFQDHEEAQINAGPMMGHIQTLQEMFREAIEVENPQQTINTIPKLKCEGEMGECGICLEGIKVGEEFRALPCSDTVNHCFHSKCIDQWLRTKNTCPTCRAKLF